MYFLEYYCNGRMRFLKSDFILNWLHGNCDILFITETYLCKGQILSQKSLSIFIICFLKQELKSLEEEFPVLFQLHICNISIISIYYILECYGFHISNT